MRSPLFKSSPPISPMPRGVALIVTLAILAILTTLLVSFVSMASLDRGATKSYSQALGADQVALGGLDQIVSQLQAEIADPQLSTNALPAQSGLSNNLYLPLTNSNAGPQRTAPNLPGLATLLSYSGTNLYTGSTPAANYSSPSSTETNSLNSRSISTNRWLKPQFTTNNAGFPVPQWIVVTRSGPQAFTNYSSLLANGTITNNTYAVGRYAYTIYDTSGLLDANVAGYPTSALTNAANKGLLPWADLTQLGIPQSAIDKMVAWRNAASSATYPASVYSAATNNGFTAVTNGDTLFLNRQELIKYAQTQNLPLTNALPYLTTFSRELNGPTWGPSTPPLSTTNYALNQYRDFSLNPRIPNPRVQTAFKRNNGLESVVGEPLVKYRFPLDKLALLEAVGTTYTIADYNNNKNNIKTEIENYFGLDLAADANCPSYRHWQYPPINRPQPAAAASGILTLDDVAALPNTQAREPDFFELLQAGILSGSLGVPGKTAAGPNLGRGDQSPATGNGLPNYTDTDDNITIQVMRIGANIIDQWDADSYPTTLTYSPLPINVYGIEDLPYPFAGFVNVYTPVTNSPPFDFYIYFELWNPHQQAPGAATSTNYPTNFQLAPFYNSALLSASDYIRPGFDTLVTNAPATTGKSTVWFYNGANTLTNLYLGDPANGPTNLVFASTPTQFREPALIPGNSTAPPPLNNVACFTPPPLTAFPTSKKPANDSNTATTPFPTNSVASLVTSYNWSIKVYASLCMKLQYMDTSGTPHTYATFMGIDDTAGLYSSGTGYYIDGVLSPNTTLSTNAFSLVKSDPRTYRLGAAENLTVPTPNANQPLSTSAGVMNNPITGSPPFGTTVSSGVTTVGGLKPYRIDMWAANDPAVTIKGATSHTPAAGTPTTESPYYQDVDGVTRWGDARNAYKLNNTSPLFTGNGANRPVLLNRPFQSVGELGYVFRDAAWKTLDFASNTSADAGLLDLFTLSDAPVVAGRVNPNTPYPQVLAALISGATQSTTNATTVSTNSAFAVAQALQSITATTPFVNRADLIANFMTNSEITALAPTGIKSEEEAVVRGIAESSNTRTWNFMIDIIAQSGRYPATAASLDNFVVEGERRYWLHIAIDRYTGQIVDKQLEVVNE